MAEPLPSSEKITTLPKDARLLVVSVARIGDTLLTTPLLRALKNAAPQGQLDCIAHPQRSSVLLNLPFVDKVLPMTKKSAWLRGRLGQRWDYAFVLGHDIPLLRFALRTTSHVIALQQENPRINQRLWRCIAPSQVPLHAVRERLMLGAPVGVGIHGCDERLAYQPTAQEIENAKNWFNLKLEDDRKDRSLIIGIQLQSFHAKAYRNWPIDNFIALAKLIRRSYLNSYFVILGGTEDIDCAKRFQNAFPENTTITCGQFTLRESAAVMSLLDTYIGVDTGPTHLAGALGLPMVALYHCYHPGHLLKPLMHPAPLAVIEHPRTDENCKRMTPMAEILVDTVWDAVQQVLSSVSPSAQLGSHTPHD